MQGTSSKVRIVSPNPKYFVYFLSSPFKNNRRQSSTVAIGSSGGKNPRSAAFFLGRHEVKNEYRWDSQPE